MKLQGTGVLFKREEAWRCPSFSAQVLMSPKNAAVSLKEAAQKALQEQETGAFSTAASNYIQALQNYLWYCKETKQNQVMAEISQQIAICEMVQGHLEAAQQYVEEALKYSALEGSIKRYKALKQYLQTWGPEAQVNDKFHGILGSLTQFTPYKLQQELQRLIPLSKNPQLIQAFLDTVQKQNSIAAAYQEFKQNHQPELKRWKVFAEVKQSWATVSPDFTRIALLLLYKIINEAPEDSSEKKHYLAFWNYLEPYGYSDNHAIHAVLSRGPKG